MSRMKLGIAFAGAAFGLCLAFAQPAALAEDNIRIAVVTHGQSADTYWSVVKKGVDDAAKLMGVDAAVTQKVQGLVVSMPDPTALEKSVKAASDAGIPVIVIDSGEKEPERLGLKFFVGTTSYFEQGVLAGKRLAAAGVTKGVCANAEPGNLTNESACDGFKEGLNGNADRVDISMDPTDTGARILAYLTAHPDTNGILALGAPQCNNIVTALRGKGIVDKYKIGNFDVNGDTLQSLSKGEILFSFDSQQYLMGYLPVVMLTLNAKYGTLPIKNIYTGPTAVTAADVEKIMVLSKKGIR